VVAGDDDLWYLLCTQTIYLRQSAIARHFGVG
jgi:hypothetical protein